MAKPTAVTPMEVMTQPRVPPADAAIRGSQHETRPRRTEMRVSRRGLVDRRTGPGSVVTVVGHCADRAAGSPQEPDGLQSRGPFPDKPMFPPTSEPTRHVYRRRRAAPIPRTGKSSVTAAERRDGISQRARACDLRQRVLRITFEPRPPDLRPGPRRARIPRRRVSSTGVVSTVTLWIRIPGHLWNWHRSMSVGTARLLA